MNACCECIYEGEYESEQCPQKWIFNARVIGDVDCCVCVWGTTGVKSALAITATSRSQSRRPARLLPAGASSAKTHQNRRGVTRPQEHTT